MRTDRERLALALLLLTAVLWSLAGAGIKMVREAAPLSAPAIAGYRSLFAGLTLLPLALWRGGLRRGRLGPLRWVAASVGFFCMMTLTFVAATIKTTAANAIILEYTAPLWVLLLAPMLTRDRARRSDLIAAALGMVGVAVIFAGHMTTEPAGVALALGAGLAFGMLTIALRRLHRADPFAVVTVNNLAAAAILLGVAGFGPQSGLTGLSAAGLVFLGVVQYAVPYALYSYSLRYVSAQRAAIVTLSEPVLNPVWTWLAVGEKPSSATATGGALIIASLVVVLRGAGYGLRRRVPPDKQREFQTE